MFVTSNLASDKYFLITSLRNNRWRGRRNNLYNMGRVVRIQIVKYLIGLSQSTLRCIKLFVELKNSFMNRYRYKYANTTLLCA